MSREERTLGRLMSLSFLHLGSTPSAVRANALDRPKGRLDREIAQEISKWSKKGQEVFYFYHFGPGALSLELH